MNNREMLRKNICKAWSETLDEAYRLRLVNSERGLQVHFCMNLLKAFGDDKVKRYLFIEPKVDFDEENLFRYPDLVICNQKHVIGVVELKYTPRARPSISKDIDTLKRLSSARNVKLSNDRYRGPSKGKSYGIAKDAVFCWAGVYSAPMLENSDLESFPGNFLRLDALTSRSSEPVLYRDGDQKYFLTPFT